MSQGAFVPIQVSRDSERPRGRDSEAGDTRGMAWSLGTVQPTRLVCGGAVDTPGRHTGQAIRGVFSCYLTSYRQEERGISLKGLLLAGSEAFFHHSTQINSNPQPQKKLPRYSSTLAVSP